jgi:hypothetical protein
MSGFRVMSKPWDIPPQGGAGKRGDETEDILYLAVGRALTKWEGLEATVAFLFAVLTGGTDDRYYEPAARVFGATMSVLVRGDMILNAAEGFFHYFESHGLHNETQAYHSDLKELIKQYKNWSSRRNDIAHGYVTATTLPDNNLEGTYTTTYLLCPSHGSSRKWSFHLHPLYQLKASEIDKFAVAFEALDESFRGYSAKLDQWRKATLIELRTR